jgi:Na+-transporting NADH:ubiquinone oxidoreductase subunit NqrD
MLNNSFRILDFIFSITLTLTVINMINTVIKSLIRNFSDNSIVIILQIILSIFIIIKIYLYLEDNDI